MILFPPGRGRVLGELFGIAYTAHTSSSSSLFDFAISLLLRGHFHVSGLDHLIYAFLVYRTSMSIMLYVPHLARLAPSFPGVQELV